MSVYLVSGDDTELVSINTGVIMTLVCPLVHSVAGQVREHSCAVRCLTAFHATATIIGNTEHQLCANYASLLPTLRSRGVVVELDGVLSLSKCSELDTLNATEAVIP